LATVQPWPKFLSQNFHIREIGYRKVYLLLKKKGLLKISENNSISEREKKNCTGNVVGVKLKY